MANRTRVIQYGLGSIGAAAVHVLGRARPELAGGVDVDPVGINNDVDIGIGAGRSLGFPAVEELAKVLGHQRS
jgi:hypothetical protein